MVVIPSACYYIIVFLRVDFCKRGVQSCLQGSKLIANSAMLAIRWKDCEAGRNNE